MLLDIFNYFINLPAATWYHAGEWLVGCTGLSVLIQTVKHRLNNSPKFTDKAVKRISVSLVGLLSFLASAVQALATSGISLGGLGEKGLAIAGTVTLLYRITVSPLYKKWFAKAEEAVKPTDETVLVPSVPVTPGFEG